MNEAIEQASEDPITSVDKDNTQHMSVEVSPERRKFHETSMRALSTRFQLGRKIGEGGMGSVFEAYDQNLERTVAVKVINEKYAKDDNMLNRFFHEAHILGTMEHPGVLPVYETGVLPNSGGPFYAMKYVRGKTLDRIFQTYNLQDRNAAEQRSSLIRIFSEICQTVAYAHSINIIHRDLKPANIMVDEFGVVVVLDWGLSKQIDRTTKLTLPGGVMGTPNFMSPEQAKGDTDAVNARSDVFALGVILYQILTGKLPFMATSPSEVFEKVLSHDPEPPRLKNRRTPRDLNAICMKALQKDPDERYISAIQLSQDIQNYLDGLPIIAYKRCYYDHIWLWIKRHPALTTFSLTFATLIIVINIAAGAFIQARRMAQTAMIEGVSTFMADIEQQVRSVDSELKIINEELAELPEGLSAERNTLEFKLGELEVMRDFYREFMRVPAAAMVGRFSLSVDRPLGDLDKVLERAIKDQRLMEVKNAMETGEYLRAHYIVWITLEHVKSMNWSVEELKDLMRLNEEIERKVREKWGADVEMPQWQKHDAKGLLLQVMQ